MISIAAARNAAVGNVSITSRSGDMATTTFIALVAAHIQSIVRMYVCRRCGSECPDWAHSAQRCEPREDVTTYGHVTVSFQPLEQFSYLYSEPVARMADVIPALVWREEVDRRGDQRQHLIEGCAVARPEGTLSVSQRPVRSE